ncbi:MAG: 50S ribosomal protein L15 [Desulfobacterales bacterium CG07_land_8_20_14_0_80_52_14]|nr:MAG: 50S ribosomal protein L15 [Desulfobacterales bacterium CG07_land_8_20_14_0_80_52_14]
MKLHELSPAPGTHKDKKRRGRGNGSGRGTTSGRGAKGQNARSGGGVRPGFEGGQMPIQRRLPKRGFTNIFKKQYSVVNIRDLSRFDGSEVVDQTVLVRAGLVQGRCDGIKLLGQGALDRPLTVRVHKVSKSALEKVLQAGGKVETV